VRLLRFAEGHLPVSRGNLILVADFIDGSALMPHFVKDVEDLRRRAEQKMDDGAVTQGYRGDVNNAIEILNEALATEIVCVLRYMHHYFMATGVHGKGVADEFKEHADAEREHADMLAERIQQLGGKPDFNPKNLLQRSVSQYVEGETLADMIREDLIAERIVIEVYQDMIRYFGNNDPTTRVILEKLLHDEEGHADDLSDLLFIVNPETAETEGQDPGTEPLRMHAGNGGQGEQVRPGGTGRRSRSSESQKTQQSSTGVPRKEMQQAEGRTTPPQPSGEEVLENHKRDRDRILNELRWMGKNKKKPAA
jgi:bacterioferritin